MVFRSQAAGWEDPLPALEAPASSGAGAGSPLSTDWITAWAAATDASSGIMTYSFWPWAE